MDAAYFIPHCDNDNCDLGSLGYRCTHCNLEGNEYEVWWLQNDIFQGLTQIFECEHCKKKLKIYFDETENEYLVINGEKNVSNS